MKVYKVLPKEAYSGGCILIAANSVEEAQSLITDEYDDYAIPIEVENVTTTVTKPTIIFNHTFFE